MCISLFLCDSLLLDVCANCCFVYPQVPPVLAQKVFTQIFSYINVQLFNRWTYISSFVSCMPGNLRSTWVHECFLFCSLLLRRECCSFSNGEYVKAGLAELELWCAKATTEVICLCLNASFPSYMIQFTEAPSFFFFIQYAAASWDELKHIRQAVGFLVWCPFCLCIFVLRFGTNKML